MLLLFFTNPTAPFTDPIPAGTTFKVTVRLEYDLIAPLTVTLQEQNGEGRPYILRLGATQNKLSAVGDLLQITIPAQSNSATFFLETDSPI